ncbi:MAG: TIGR00299 family protein [Candidatus Riflebacteria bacterium HGW-Riflebacteria-2]|jgi:hypothetical protein|nr:MAG: TIGR00299 family protein [Candidatus Riflebacteria bacterium HGW-Riflebacteria-2]
MTKILYWDCFSGIAGNMAVASLLDLGASREKLQEGLASMAFPEGKIELIIEEKSVDGIRGIYFNTKEDHAENGDSDHHHEHAHDEFGGVPEAGFLRHEPLHEHNHCHEHGSDHQHEHGHQEHSHDHHCETEKPHEHTGNHHHAPHRGLKEITALIEQAAITGAAKALAITCFRVLAEAEATIHGKTVDEVHFHEVGARDSIADIVGMAICLDDLGIEQVHVSPVHLGSGVVKCAHGIMPVPAPATALLLKNLPVVFDHHIAFELTTPTGAAILQGLAATPISEQFTFAKVGHGHGSRKIGQANFLRAFLGETGQLKKNSDSVTVLTSNIDNASGEQLGNAISEFMQAGALDACLIPMIMKKGRPANQLQVMTAPENASHMETLIFRLLPTLGIRVENVTRSILPRETVLLQTSFGPVAAKKIHYPDGTIKINPEYDELVRLSQQHQTTTDAVRKRLIAESMISD